MTVLERKVVITRKPHMCFACYRHFEKGVTMRSETNDYDGINTIYTCKTCIELIDKYPELFIDDCEYIFPSGCVIESIPVGLNPEEWLKELTIKETV